METHERSHHRDVAIVAGAAALVSVAAFLFFYFRGEILLYGDAVAHINIARRVFDSNTPGPLQLGTVWLPLPHILMIPFVVNDWMWRSGVGGSIPSMIATSPERFFKPRTQASPRCCCNNGRCW